MDKGNNLFRLLALLLLTLVLTFGFYGLPDTVLGYKIKKVDLLSDFKVKEDKISLDSLRKQLEQADTLIVDSTVLRDSVMRASGIDSLSLALRDSLYRTLYAVEGADSLGVHIEDYSLGHIALKRFFAALKDRQTLNRPVRVAFLGDSFIEGDILVADFRAGLQRKFGGRGVGFVPVTSAAVQYRPTIEQQVEGWTTWSMLTDHDHAYALSGLMFEPEADEASIRMKTTDRYPDLKAFSSVKLIYERNEHTEMRLSTGIDGDTIREQLPPASGVTQYVHEGNDITEVDFSFHDMKNFRVLGVAMEDNSGVSVDNFSLRGNSGLVLGRLDKERCRALEEIRPYDLIVLQYGLNVVSDSVMNYGWYASRMAKIIEHVRDCFPKADVLILGVSDRSRQVDGEFETMPAVFALLHAQRQTAKKMGVAFWNVFGAMGGENSMVRFVENDWASKDYTHLSFRGGREIANALLKALLSEKDFYDEVENMVN